jgi:hypothetical protein
MAALTKLAVIIDVIHDLHVCSFTNALPW